MTDHDLLTGPLRVALVVARHRAAQGAPPGVDPVAFSAACLADTYEVVADLVGVSSGIVGAASETDHLLWPGAVHLPDVEDYQTLAGELSQYRELVLVPADAPDLPGLVIAKVFRALQRADVCVAPERGAGGGCVAIGIKLPWPTWLPAELDLDRNPLEQLTALAPSRVQLASGPSWHRLRTPNSIRRLDLGLEGWDETRALLTGQVAGR